MTRDWQSIAPPDEELIAEYKRIEPELRYLTWWYGDDCEDLIPPHSIDPWFIETLLAHWEASDPEHFLRQLYTDRLPHDIIRVVRVTFSELRRLELVHHMRFEDAKTLVIHNMLLATTPRYPDLFDFFQPPEVNADGVCVHPGIGLQ